MAFACALLAVLLFAPPADFLAEGLKALDANEPAAAEPLLRQAVEAVPSDYSAHFNLAIALSMQQKDAEAIGEFHKTLELKPGLYQADLNLGMLLLRNKRPGEALPVLKEAIDSQTAADVEKASPQKAARTDLYYAQALFETGDMGQAEVWYRAAAERDPKSAAAQAGLAHSLLKESKLAEAAEHFREAAALDPHYRDGLLELAAAYEKAGTLPEAIAVYRQFPDNPAAAERLAQLLVANGNAAAAIPNLELAVKTTPSVANRLALADAYKLNKQVDRAIEQLQLAVASEPSNYDLRMDLGREFRDAHKAAETVEQFSAAARLRPDSVKAWNELATVYVVTGDYANGLAALDRVRALGKELPGDFYFRAICLEKLRQLKPALEAYQRFLATDENKQPDQEFLARQRVRIIKEELDRPRR
ncbi:MAG: tetratricopeptide repeat protein [Bryobacteraceae bacterium]|jgi:tetratricopeptide (TPR) repeat protein